MKNRERRLLNLITNRGEVSISYLLNYFQISKRTLYYDISNINLEIVDLGKIIIVDKVLKFEQYDVGKIYDESYTFDSEKIQYELILKILLNTFTNIESESELFNVSKNTIVKIIALIKDTLKSFNLTLIFKGNYMLLGDEIDIVKLYIYTDQVVGKRTGDISPKVITFNKLNELKLTDYSMHSLADLMNFVRLRNKSIIFKEEDQDIIELSNWELLNVEKETDKIFFSKFIMSLPNTKTAKVDHIDLLIHNLISAFENYTNINISRKEEFSKNLRSHLYASYYRIKFGFPIYNPLMDEILCKYEYLYKIVQDIIKNNEKLNSISNARKEEIGYLTSYFGGYLYYSREYDSKVIIVCPSGLVISNSLKYQIQNLIPNIKIDAVYGVNELLEKNIDYDYCISTVNIDRPNVILVNSILGNDDIKKIDRIINKNFDSDLSKVNKIVDVVKKYASIDDEVLLKHAISKVLMENYKKENPMLKELLTKEKINKIKSINDYKEAIRLAAKPLLDDHTIEEEYIEEMLQALEKFGPYIVLADRFALPHASSKVGVNAVGMSMLILDESVDLMGKPVNIFCVLASPDNESHLRALTSISELFCDESNIERFIKEDKNIILKKIEEVS